MEDITNWYKTFIRKGVILDDIQTNRIPFRDFLTSEYKEWETRCEGKIVFERDFTKENYIDPICYIHFEKEEDLVNYKLTFDEIENDRLSVDAAFFYCPYIPLSMSGVKNDRV